jgi:hypothetical protein
VVTEASRCLVALAEELTAAYEALMPARAVLLTGSAARGDSDFHSDLDLILFYGDELPSDDHLHRARGMVGVPASEPSISRAAGYVGENFVLRGVECQVYHQMVAAYERELAEVLDECVARSTQQRAVEGVQTGIALRGEDLIGHWRERAARYPENLAREMVDAYFRFFPLWRFPHLIATRDVDLWVRQVVVESAQNVLGVLAGLNRVYYTPVQLKRTHHFIEQLRLAPRDLAARLDELLAADLVEASEMLEGLVAETTDLVEQHMPGADTSTVRQSLEARERPWHPWSVHDDPHAP